MTYLFWPYREEIVYKFFVCDLLQSIESQEIFSKHAVRAQWSVGVSKPIYEISNVHRNMNFLEAFVYIFIKNGHKTVFKAVFRCFDKL